MLSLPLRTMRHLLLRDLKSFWTDFGSKLIDTLILFLTNVIIFAYFMQGEGLSKNYGAFMLIGSIASFGLIEIVGKVGLFMADLEGDRTISHTLMLPIKTGYVFCYIALVWAITGIFLTIPLFFVGKLILFDRWDLSLISYWRLIIMYLSANIFYGFWGLWLASILKGMSSLNMLWQRFVAPMWMFGAYFFVWHTAYDLNPLAGIVMLVNPMVYIMEGMHGAALGQEGFIPYWINLVVIWCFIFAAGIHACRRLRKRLDCV